MLATFGAHDFSNEFPNVQGLSQDILLSIGTRGFQHNEHHSSGNYLQLFSGCVVMLLLQTCLTSYLTNDASSIGLCGQVLFKVENGGRVYDPLDSCL